MPSLRWGVFCLAHDWATCQILWEGRQMKHFCWSWLSISIHHIHAGNPHNLLFFPLLSCHFSPPAGVPEKGAGRGVRDGGWGGQPRCQPSSHQDVDVLQRVTYEKMCFLLCFTSIKAVSLYHISEINLKIRDDLNLMFKIVGEIPSETVWKSADPFKKLLAG